MPRQWRHYRRTRLWGRGVMFSTCSFFVLLLNMWRHFENEWTDLDSNWHKCFTVHSSTVRYVQWFLKESYLRGAHVDRTRRCLKVGSNSSLFPFWPRSAAACMPRSGVPLTWRGLGAMRPGLCLGHSAMAPSASTGEIACHNAPNKGAQLNWTVKLHLLSPAHRKGAISVAFVRLFVRRVHSE